MGLAVTIGGLFTLVFGRIADIMGARSLDEGCSA